MKQIRLVYAKVTVRGLTPEEVLTIHNEDGEPILEHALCIASRECNWVTFAD